MVAVATERKYQRRWWPAVRKRHEEQREVVRASAEVYPKAEPTPGRRKETIKTLRSSHLGKVEMNTTIVSGGVETTRSLKITRHYANEGY